MTITGNGANAGSFFRRSVRGLSLVETAIVLMIAGLLMVAFLRMYYIVELRQRLETTKTRLEDLRTSLQLYVATNDRLPCPASPRKVTDDGQPIDICAPDVRTPPEGIIAMKMAADDDDTVVAERAKRLKKDQSNEIWLGVVPVKDMRLDPEEARDGWGNEFSYAVSRRLTLPHGMHGNPTPPGSITVVDQDGKSVLDKPDTGRWVILSHGPSGFGAWGPEGGRKPCPPGTLDAANCEDTGVFVTAPFSTAASDQFYDQFLIFDDLASGGNLVDRIAKCNLKLRYFYPADPNADDEGCVYEQTIWHGVCTTSKVQMSTGGPFIPFGAAMATAPAVVQGSACGCTAGYTSAITGTWDNSILLQQMKPPPAAAITSLYTCY